jgi:hypothetical protein
MGVLNTFVKAYLKKLKKDFITLWEEERLEKIKEFL